MEIKRYQQFSYSILGRETEFDRGNAEANVRTYAKHVLMNGTRDEKRELLGCLKSRIEIRNKGVYINIGK